VYIHECVCKQNLLKGGRKVMGQAETVRDVCARLSVSAPAYAWVRVLRVSTQQAPHIHDGTYT